MKRGFGGTSGTQRRLRSPCHFNTRIGNLQRLIGPKRTRTAAAYAERLAPWDQSVCWPRKGLAEVMQLLNLASPCSCRALLHQSCTVTYQSPREREGKLSPWGKKLSFRTAGGAIHANLEFTHACLITYASMYVVK